MRSLFTHLLAMPGLFWGTAVLVTILCVVGTFNAQGFASITHHINLWIFNAFGGFYLWFGLLTCVGAIGIALSPFGNIRLGGQQSQPKHSFFSWCAMLFATGMGTGIMFWGAAEPLYHFMTPPLRDVVAEPDRVALAFRYAFFHWGLVPWAIYALTGLAISFLCFNKNNGFLPSALLLHHTQERSLIRSVLGFALDLMTLMAIVVGVASTFGMSILHLEGGLDYLANVPPSGMSKGFIIGTLTVVFVLSAVRGLEKGIKQISNASMWICFVLMGALFCLGPQLRILSGFGQALVSQVTHFIPMSLGLEAYADPDWVRWWVIKYWSWWIAWAPFVGMFIAYISKGRTIRELLLTVLLVPTLFCWLWFVLWGQTAIYLEQSQQLFGGMVPFDQVSLIVFQMMEALTHQPIVSWVCVVLIALFFINSADSATYTTAFLSQHIKNDETTPSRVLKVAWGILFCMLATLFVFAGGIDMLQEVTLITTLPFTFLLVAIFGKFFWSLFQEDVEKAVPSKSQQES